MRSFAVKERDYDVIVYGAGPEGVAAALAAAEHSDSVLLADECPDVGGSAVCGLLNFWRGEAESSAMECVRKLTKKAWGKLIFEPEELSQAFRKMLSDASVDLMLNARPIKAKVKQGRLKSVSFATQEGRVKLTAWCYVDASQDCILARLADCATDDAGGESASAALLVRIGGIDTRVPGVFDAESLRQFAGNFKAEQAVEEIPEQLAYPALVPCLRGGTAILNASGDGMPLGAGELARTRAESRCREGALATIGFLQRNVPGYENCFLIHFAAQPIYQECPRPLRRKPESAAVEEFEMAIEDIPVLSYRDADRPDMTVSVPFGHLLCPEADNLVLARTASMQRDQMPLLLAAGEAAGKAAAQAVLYDGCISKLEPESLRKALITTII